MQYRIMKYVKVVGMKRELLESGYNSENAAKAAVRQNGLNRGVSAPDEIVIERYDADSTYKAISKLAPHGKSWWPIE